MKKLLVALFVVGTCALAQAPVYRETDFQGQRIVYEVIDGNAVVGDIILGPVAEFNSKSARASSAVRLGSDRLWPNGRVPYTFDTSVTPSLRLEIRRAMDQWQVGTGLQFVERTATDSTGWIEFREPSTTGCSAGIGRAPGNRAQSVNLKNCSFGAILHEIGHALGLYHTQSRIDRDLYVDVDVTALSDVNALRDQYTPDLNNSQDLGPYPYDSVMHYSGEYFAADDQYVIQTIPRGIPIGDRQELAPSDRDAINRLYGSPAPSPRTVTVTITTNPPGIPLLIDSDTQLTRTPATRTWEIGSLHTLKADELWRTNPLYAFARWSNFGPPSQEVVAPAEPTVYTANYSFRPRVDLTSNPSDAGDTAPVAAPYIGLAKDHFPLGAYVQLQATPKPGFRFVEWVRARDTNSFVLGGTNPRRVQINTDQRPTYIANFTESPVTTIATDPPGLRLSINNTPNLVAPRNYVWPNDYRQLTLFAAPATQTAPNRRSRFTFERWTNVEAVPGAARQSYTVTNRTTTVTAKFQAEYLVSAVEQEEGRIDVNPALPADGFVREGTELTITARPNASFGFQEWIEGASGSGATVRLRVTGPLRLRARFTRPGQISSVVNSASQIATAIAPGQIVTIKGSNIGPAEPAGLALNLTGFVATERNQTQVLFDGIPAPLTYVSPGQINCVVPYGIAGRSTTRISVQVGDRLPTEAFEMPVAAAAPSLFTADSTGVGPGAFLNEDGRLNSLANPAAPGSVVVLFATGTGVTIPSQRDGEVTTGPAYPALDPLAVRVLVADREAEILYAGAAPQIVSGLAQLNVRLPAGVGSGAIPVTLQIGRFRSPRIVTVAVR